MKCMLVISIIIGVLCVIYEIFIKKKVIFHSYKKIYIQEINYKGNEKLSGVSSIYDLENELAEYIEENYKDFKKNNLKKIKIKRRLNSAMFVEGFTIISVVVSMIMTLYTTTLTNTNTMIWNTVTIEYRNIDSFKEKLKMEDLSEDKKNEISENINKSYKNIQDCVKNVSSNINSSYGIIIIVLLVVIFFAFYSIIREFFEYKKAFYTMIIELLDNANLEIKDKKLVDEVKDKIDNIKIILSDLNLEVSESKKLIDSFIKLKK